MVQPRGGLKFGEWKNKCVGVCARLLRRMPIGEVRERWRWSQYQQAADCVSMSDVCYTASCNSHGHGLRSAVSLGRLVGCKRKCQTRQGLALWAQKPGDRRSSSSVERALLVTKTWRDPSEANVEVEAEQHVPCTRGPWSILWRHSRRSAPPRRGRRTRGPQ